MCNKMRYASIRCLFIIFIILATISTSAIWFLRNKLIIIEHNTEENTNLIIWWTPFIGKMEYTKQCGTAKCTFTGDRTQIHSTGLHALLFYASNINHTDLPLPRNFNIPWALFHEESPKNMPYLLYDSAMSIFNITSTISHESDFPITLHHLKSMNELRGRKYLVAVGEKSRLQKTLKLAPVLFIQSICDTMSGRDEYVSELMQHIDIDSYGACLNNRELPVSLSKDYLSTIESEEFYRFIARYKFVIAYENGVCSDYITEKLWRPLVLGTVPIYFGAPNVEMWLPNNRSVVLIKNFGSPAELAEHIKMLNTNDVEYNKYLDHKYRVFEPIANRRLVDVMVEKPFGSDNIIDGFECFVCNATANRDWKRIATGKAYNCGDKLQYPRMSKSMQKNGWNDYVRQARCTADLVRDFVVWNKSYDSEKFYEKLHKRFNEGVCQL